MHLSAQAIGGILGSLAIPRLSKIFAPCRLMGVCGLTFSSVIAVLALVPVVPVILPLIAIGGAGAVSFFIPMLTLLQTNVANEYQGRIFGALSTIQAVALLMGMASGLGDHIGIVSMQLIDAGFNILAALLAFVLICISLQPIQPTQPATEISANTGELEAPGVTTL